MSKDGLDTEARMIIWHFRDKCNDILMEAFKNGLTERDFSDETWIDLFDEAVADCRRLSYVARDQLSKLYDE